MIKIKIFSLLLLIFCLSSCSYTEKKENVNYNREEKTESKKTETKKAEYVMLSTATTKLYDKTENRINNIKIALDTINNMQIKQNETFSFNTATGERTEEKGYKIAPIILHGEKDEAVGGGVCQISSTIFMAAKDAGLLIKERHAHQKPVNYAKEGDDAAVNYGSEDFVFVNNTENKIMIKCALNEDSIIVEILKETFVN